MANVNNYVAWLLFLFNILLINNKILFTDACYKESVVSFIFENKTLSQSQIYKRIKTKSLCKY